MGPVDYSSPMTPNEYTCTSCGVSGVKLWREYNTFADQTVLECACCAMDSQKKEGEVDQNGLRKSEYGTTDQIGWRVPAIPTPEGESFWGYTSVPTEGCEWWRKLPTRYTP
jgi:hypothetical protein